jgi:hypothetical protein
VEVRVEADLAEVADGDEYLMICAQRKKVFLGGSTQRNLSLAEVSGFVVSGSVGSGSVGSGSVGSGRETAGAALFIQLVDGATIVCPLASATQLELTKLAARLEACRCAWS